MRIKSMIAAVAVSAMIGGAAQASPIAPYSVSLLPREAMRLGNAGGMALGVAKICGPVMAGSGPWFGVPCFVSGGILSLVAIWW